jgi:hypothetical protein
MPALGQKQTLAHVRVMSALPAKADIDRTCPDVRFVPKADIRAYPTAAKRAILQKEGHCSAALWRRKHTAADDGAGLAKE